MNNLSRKQSIESKHVRINYDIYSTDYIKDLYDYLEKKILKIKEYLEINTINEPAEVTIYSEYNEFIKNVLKYNKYYKKVDDIPSYVVADGGDDKHISVLSFNEYINVEGHQKCTIEDYKKTLVHELVHFYHHKLNKINMIWINEGLAIYLSEQAEKYTSNKLNVQLKTYSDYYLVFKYVLENYDKNYILKLISNVEMQKIETPKILKKIENVIKRVEN